MTEQPDTRSGEPIPGYPVPPAARPRRAWLLVAVAVVAALTGAATTKAVSGPLSFGHGWHHGFRGPMSAERIEDRADRMVRHLAIEIDASAEQQDKLRAVMKAAVRDVLPAREKAQAARQQARALLTQPTIDRAAVEKLRSEQIALADSVSKRMAQALVDAAEILTPDQRKKLDEHFPPFGGYMRGGRRG